MSQAEAMQLAVKRFGNGATVGFGRPVSDWRLHVYYVGYKEHGDWRWIGISETSFDEAFANVKKVKLHMRDKLVCHD